MRANHPGARDFALDSPPADFNAHPCRQNRALMLLQLPVCLLLFFGITFGLAWPLAARLVADPAEQLVTSAALSLLGIFLFAWGVYVLALPPAGLWVLPALALARAAAARRSLAAALSDRGARGLVTAQLLVTGWCVGWLALVVSYSGGGWAGDWFEHWERTQFFLQHWPRDYKFLGAYPLAARPPLVNVVTGVFLQVTRVDFPHYQLVSTLLASLVFLPAGLLARRFGGGLHAIAVLAVLFMVSPLFVQNATFAWTKLPAAFFVLAALYFFLRAWDGGTSPTTLVLGGTLLAAGLVAHYSAGPYAVMLAIAWLTLRPPALRGGAWWRATGLAVLAGALVLVMWFGWSWLAYGARGTLLSNSSVTSGDMHHGNQAVKIGLNLFDTFVPHIFRRFDPALIAQRSTWGWWRDVFFQCYQLNLPLAFGSVAWLAILRELVRASRAAAPGVARFWVLFAIGVVFLGIATHGERDHWGLTHICLQAFVLLGLAFLAAHWSDLGRGCRLALIAGATVDFTLGIALQFAVQNFAPDRWLAAGRSLDDTIASYNATALMNLAAKLQHGVSFFGDSLALPFLVPAVWLVTVFVVALRRARPAPT